MESIFRSKDIRQMPANKSFSWSKSVMFSQPPSLQTETISVAAETAAKKLPISLQKRMGKTKICTHNLTGRCNRGDACSFAHSQDELITPPNLYKTRLCQKFIETGVCPRMDTCRFAHGDFELRSTPEFFKTSLCPYYQAKIACPAGDQCRWAHGTQEIRPRSFQGKLSEGSLPTLTKKFDSLASDSYGVSNEDQPLNFNSKIFANQQTPKRMNAQDEIWFGEICKALLLGHKSVASGLCNMDSNYIRRLSKKVASEPNIKALYVKNSQPSSMVHEIDGPGKGASFDIPVKPSVAAADLYNLSRGDIEVQTKPLEESTDIHSITFDSTAMADLAEAVYLQKISALGLPDFQHSMNFVGSNSEPNLFNWISTSAETKPKNYKNQTNDTSVTDDTINLDLLMNSYLSSNEALVAASGSGVKSPFKPRTSFDEIMSQMVLNSIGSGGLHSFPSLERRSSAAFSKANFDLLGCSLQDIWRQLELNN